MKWTNEQSRAINKRNSNILISAAAGSGKTTVLVERIRRLVIGDENNPPVPIDRLLVLTFTNAAASEMRQKIIDSISDELEKSDSDYLRTQLRLVFTANISTFHMFAHSIIKRYYFIIGIDPVFSICDEMQKDFLVEEALDILFEEYFNAETEDKEFIDFLKKYARVRNEDSVREIITKTYDFIRTLPNPFEWLAEKTAALAASVDEFVYTEAFAEILKEVMLDIEESIERQNLLYEQISEIVPVLAKKILVDTEALECILDEARNTKDIKVMYENLAAAINGFKFSVFSATKAEKEDYAEIKDVVTSRRTLAKSKVVSLKKGMFAKSLDEYIAEINDTYPSAKKLEEMILKFHDIFSELKSRDGVIDFNDVEHFALEILNDERVRAEYREKFEHIFVDEYQDTNYIQEELIARIKSDRNMFMVGDVKQSIYKFRHAEPEIFIEKYRSFSDNEESENYRIDLNKNYRSKHKIIDDVNGIFKAIMLERISGIAYDDKSALHKGLDYEVLGYDGSCDTSVDYVLIDKSAPIENDSTNEDELQDEDILELVDAELEASVAANLIKEAISGKSKGQFFDVSTGANKDYDYRDIVVLLREVKTSGQIWYDTLQANGIPAFVASGDGYFNTIEIETFLNLLRLLDNTCQDVPLVGTMYSPIFDFSTEQLITIRQAFPEGPFYKALFAYVGDGTEIENSAEETKPYIDEALKEKCEKMLSALDEWRKKEMFLDLSEFLWELLKESGYYDYAGALPAGVQRRANLLALIDKARAFRTKNSRGLFGFVRFVEKINNNKVSIGEVKLFSEGDNAVRIMSIHNSKGLEFPMVIVPQNAKSLRAMGGNNKISLHREIGIALQWENLETHTYKSTLFQRMIKFKESFEDRAEALRVFYVALTRAMDRLVIIGTKKNAGALLDAAEEKDSMLDVDVMSSSTSFSNMLLPLFSESNINVSLLSALDIQNSIMHANSGNNSAERLIQYLDNAEQSDFYPEIDRRLSFVYPEKTSHSVKSKYSVSEINKAGMQIDVNADAKASDNIFIAGSDAETIDETGRSAAMRGTILHTAFEKIDYAEAFANKDNKEYFEEYLHGLVNRNIIPDDFAKTIKAEQIMKYVNSEIFERAACAREVNRETPFIFKYKYLGEEVIAQGIIDLWFIENDGIILVDFKSGRFEEGKPGEEERLINTYKGQIKVYSQALESIMPVPVNEAYLYLTRAGKTIEIYE